jgi:predicted nucleic acid-binding protein
MNYLLDSNTLSDFYDRDSIGHHAIFTHLSHLSDNTRIFISILSLYEFEYGYANASEVLRPTIRAKITEAQEDFEILPLSNNGAMVFGEIKFMLKKKRGINAENIKKHNFDLMLASEALTHDYTLVSADKIFQDI